VEEIQRGSLSAVFYRTCTAVSYAPLDGSSSLRGFLLGRGDNPARLSMLSRLLANAAGVDPFVAIVKVVVLLSCVVNTLF
jgi:hypothetical protein